MVAGTVAVGEFFFDLTSSHCMLCPEMISSATPLYGRCYILKLTIGSVTVIHPISIGIIGAEGLGMIESEPLKEFKNYQYDLQLDFQCDPVRFKT